MNKKTSIHIFNPLLWFVLTCISMCFLLLNFNGRDGFNANFSSGIKTNVLSIKYFFTDGVFNYFINATNKNQIIFELRRENQLLKSRVALTQEQELELNNLKQEVVQFKSLLNIVDNKEIKEMITTTVLSDSIENLKTDMLIGIGKNKGIQNRTLVISPNGLVGYIVDVRDTNSKVLTIYDHGFRIAAISGQSHLNLVVNGNGTDTPTLTLYAQNNKLIENEVVYTSGLEGKFPKQMPIGKVMKDPDNKKNWKVQIFETFETLQYVYVVK